jgi:hypothetical protein
VQVPDESGQLPQEKVPITLYELRVALHDLCQPLSALQCRLYLGTLDDEPSNMREAIMESVSECERMVEMVRALQNRIRS